MNKKKIWNVERYKQIISTYIGKKTDGIYLIRRTDVYDYLSNETGIAKPGAFESWAKTDSPGPNQASLKMLEEYWGICLTSENENIDKEKKAMSHYNNFVAEHIYNIVKIIKKFIHSENVDDEDAFYEMSHNVEIESFCIPEDIEYLFYDFIEERLEPIIYNKVELFGENPQFEDFMKYIIKVELEFNELLNSQIRPLLVY